MPPQRSLKQRIHDGDQILGVTTATDVGRSRLEEILGKDSYDFVWVDSRMGVTMLLERPKL